MTVAVAELPRRPDPWPDPMPHDAIGAPLRSAILVGSMPPAVRRLRSQVTKVDASRREPWIG
ncbi:MAG: hypothetical protein QOE61_5614 [Micromonosporaceae bacterium]|jgi:hypothetical protein|nr:hypothetical protein [Micromonosporaceae bacterium]